MGCGHTVYNLCCTVHRRSLHGCSGRTEARSIFPLYRMHLHSSPRTKKIFFLQRWYSRPLWIRIMYVLSTLKKLLRLLKCPSPLYLVGISSLILKHPFFAMTHLFLPTDIAVFTLVAIQTKIMKSMHRGMNGSSILDTINRDTRTYFALIATSHFVIVIMYIVTRVRSFVLVSKFDGC